jgi:hypothetical protein
VILAFVHRFGKHGVQAFFDKTGERSGESDSKAAGWTGAASDCKHTHYKTYLRIDTRSTQANVRAVKDHLIGTK